MSNRSDGETTIAVARALARAGIRAALDEGSDQRDTDPDAFVREHWERFVEQKVETVYERSPDHPTVAAHPSERVERATLAAGRLLIPDAGAVDVPPAGELEERLL